MAAVQALGAKASTGRSQRLGPVCSAATLFSRIISLPLRQEVFKRGLGNMHTLIYECSNSSIYLKLL